MFITRILSGSGSRPANVNKLNLGDVRGSTKRELSERFSATGFRDSTIVFLQSGNSAVMKPVQFVEVPDAAVYIGRANRQAAKPKGFHHTFKAA